jgi:hypothetical protein
MHWILCHSNPVDSWRFDAQTPASYSMWKRHISTWNCRISMWKYATIPVQDAASLKTILIHY